MLWRSVLRIFGATIMLLATAGFLQTSQDLPTGASPEPGLVTASIPSPRQEADPQNYVMRWVVACNQEFGVDGRNPNEGLLRSCTSY